MYVTTNITLSLYDLYLQLPATSCTSGISLLYAYSCRYMSEPCMSYKVLLNNVTMLLKKREMYVASTNIRYTLHMHQQPIYLLTDISVHL